ncbi:threonine--tRNA ligase [Thermoleophilum album]|uniref:Threonine--tRNA ligase n=1 Tax=Thermoleophilum album TaxID=29539 RepID=A0A1H6FW79_THEAL|nr:threonine--tRNA ligase [Thermoleophilum album]SEH15037.1 threonyl-tRNA synthetase [Thermoleophilum album]
MTVYLPDGTALALAEGATGADAAAAIGAGLARAALAVRIERDGQRFVQDLALPLRDGDRIEILTERSAEDTLGPLWLIRHDAAHVLAESVLELWPGTKVAIGPPIEDGFYYDFEFPPGVTVTVDDLPRIEERMREHVAADEPFERIEMPAAEARELFERAGQQYKVELIDDLVREQGVETVSLYRNGPFLDLCRGPHGPSTGRIGAFKLTSVAGAYWRGDPSRKQLTRIYGTAFFRKRDLEQHLARIELAKARDHRRLGRELGLFMLSELSPGSPFWLPRGTAVWNELTRLWREENSRRGYLEVRTPILYDRELWKQSGHWQKFRDNMYFTEVEGRPMGLKPMNCPAHIQIYRRERRSYRDLPLRFAEQGLVHRHEPSGTLHGLLRVRHITQDDAHIFCREEQVRDEVLACLEFAFDLYQLFGFEPRAHLSTRPPQRIGSDELWDRAEGALRSALEARGLDYRIDPGEGTFYGPKIDLHMTDALGRGWQLGTIQLDYQMPERFALTYVGDDNAEHRPVMIHRALMGSFERFIGILIEHYGGDFPFWLAPLQVAVLPVADRHLAYARTVAERLRAEGLRAEVDERSESVGRKIRAAELQKVPYMLVVGDAEERERTVAVRRRGRGDVGRVPLEAFVAERARAYAERARE